MTIASSLAKRYILAQPQGFSGRFILLHEDNPDYAWSGLRWVPIGGCVQISNFDTAEDARAYAFNAGLVDGSQVSA